jgi:transcriptional regulator
MRALIVILESVWMYCPARFTQSESAPMHALVADHPLGMLVTQQGGMPDADHLPFELVVEEGVLRAHVARGNPVWRRAGQRVLVVFRGPSGYATPDRIEKAGNGGRVVPTWTYNVVHVHGTLRAIDDRDWLRALVERQTDHQEAALPDPWSVDDAPTDYTARLLAAIVGIEIVIDRIEGKWKSEPPPRVATAQLA